MNDLIYLLVIGVSLSIDAFSVSLNLGWQLTNYKQVLFAITVSIFHFFMPLLGAFFGTNIKHFVMFDSNLLLGIILIILAINSLVNINKKDEINKVSFLTLLVIALSVSLDSFSVGLGLIFGYVSIILASIIFSFCSGLITYLGLIIGKYLSNKFENSFKIIGVVMLLFLGIIHILK